MNSQHTAVEPPPPYSVSATIGDPPPYSVNATTNYEVVQRGHNIGHETHRVALELPTRFSEQIAPNFNTVQVGSPNLTIVQVQSSFPQSEENRENSSNSSSQQPEESARQNVNSPPQQPTERAEVNSSSLAPLESGRQILTPESVSQGGSGRLQFADRLRRNREVAPASDTCAGAGGQQEGHSWRCDHTCCCRRFEKCLIACGVVVVGVLVLALPVSMIAVGVVHWDDCPAEPMIPVYLTVAGAAAVALIMLAAAAMPCIDKYETLSHIALAIGGLLVLFHFIWWLAGCVFVYRIHYTYTDEVTSSDYYCHKTLYTLAFAVVTTVYIFVAIGLCLASAAG